MTESPPAQFSRARSIRIHATNIIGLGAVQVLQSLLPAMEQLEGYDVRTVYLPERGALQNYRAAHHSTTVVRRRRHLPKAISRVLECTILARSFEGDGGLLVLGDIPLRCRGRQVVYVQSLLLTKNAVNNEKIGAIRYVIARSLFRLNRGFASAFIVQSEAMKAAMTETYPDISTRIHVIGLPAPDWLLACGLKRTGVVAQEVSGLRLFYPAAGYPHKNHDLLRGIESEKIDAWPVSSLTLTIDGDLNPNPQAGWIKCVGRLKPEEVLYLYAAVDGLLFLSLSESYGLPLVEAMWIGLPIICPDLPYARSMCGSEAIYFDPRKVSSLRAAVVELNERLKTGWWPDWREPLKAIPESWSAVAAFMLRITADKTDDRASTAG